MTWRSGAWRETRAYTWHRHNRDASPKSRSDPDPRRQNSACGGRVGRGRPPLKNFERSKQVAGQSKLKGGAVACSGKEEGTKWSFRGVPHVCMHVCL